MAVSRCGSGTAGAGRSGGVVSPSPSPASVRCVKRGSGEDKGNPAGAAAERRCAPACRSFPRSDPRQDSVQVFWPLCCLFRKVSFRLELSVRVVAAAPRCNFSALRSSQSSGF